MNKEDDYNPRHKYPTIIEVSLYRPLTKSSVKINIPAKEYPTIHQKYPGWVERIAGDGK